MSDVRCPIPDFIYNFFLIFKLSDFRCQMSSGLLYCSSTVADPRIHIYSCVFSSIQIRKQGGSMIMACLSDRGHDRNIFVLNEAVKFAC